VFDLLIIGPLTNLVLLFYHIFGENLGLAIIFFTIVLRVVLLPLTIRQIKQQKKMATLQPRLQELQANRKEASQMSAEEVALMKQTAGSCLGGCLPLLVQIPILIGLNSVIRQISSNPSGDVFNHLLYFDFLKHDAAYHFHTLFLRFDLAGIPSKIGFTKAIIPYAILIVLLVATQFIQGKMMALLQQKKPVSPSKAKPNAKKPAVVSTKEAEKVKAQEDMQKMMQMQTTYLIPVMIGMASYSFSAALGMYWLTQNVFAMGQMYVQNRMSGDTTSSKPLKEAEVKPIREAEFVDANVDDKLEKSPSKKNKKSKNKK
jgi:YidC/Oxa1 family membrane protein insertase